MSYFDRICLVNRKKRTDRLANFKRLQDEKEWHLIDPIIFQAIEGDKIGVPKFFTQGGGAFGCRQSHIECLQRAIMDDVESLLMLEDDVTWFFDAWENLDQFMDEVPVWDMLMLGGQHISSPVKVSDNVVRVTNCQRTHAYAIKGEAMKSLLSVWQTANVHIDWVMGGWQKDWHVYAPTEFIFGQSGGQSDISGRKDEPKFWIAPGEVTVLHLTAPANVVQKLRNHGIHTGYMRNTEDLDKGLCNVVTSKNRSQALKGWLDVITWEAMSIDGGVATVWHPEITADEVKEVWSNVIEVDGNTVDECLKKLEGVVKLKPNYSSSHILVVRSNREAVETIGGFHKGYWVDHVSGMDNGLRDIATRKEGDDRRKRLKEWINLVGLEAERSGNVLMIWHPEITLEEIKQATNKKVVEIVGGNSDEIMMEWKKNR